MAVQWTKHRFSGDLLILDATNTVVLRGDPVRSFDRFGDAFEIARFADAASLFRAAELGDRPLTFERSDAAAKGVIDLREAADRLFRSAADTGGIQAAHLPPVLRATAACLDGAEESLGGPDRPFGDPSRPMRFEVALAVSALSLLAGDAWRRIRICANCGWLFIDKSRNASRLWCDMSVCGNRQKARRHYERRKAVQEVEYA
jgi:predicted RNA-binding Zn ribbon-like protein